MKGWKSRRVTDSKPCRYTSYEVIDGTSYGYEIYDGSGSGLLDSRYGCLGTLAYSTDRARQIRCSAPLLFFAAARAPAAVDIACLSALLALNHRLPASAPTLYKSSQGIFIPITFLILSVTLSYSISPFLVILLFGFMDCAGLKELFFCFIISIVPEVLDVIYLLIVMWSWHVCFLYHRNETGHGGID